MKRLFSSVFLIIGVCLFTAGATFSQNTKEPFLPLKIDEPPQIDGVLDETIWQNAPFETGFVSYSPDYGKRMKENTKVWYAYDRENLYFAFRCYDSEPDKIKASVGSRDKIRSDDWIGLNLDTFNDHQSLYALYVNPLGIQMDSRATAVSEDYSINVVWYNHGKIDDEGYAIEIQIPFKSIRFSHKDPVEIPNKGRELTTDFLASFTYIPGTVIHLGYGSLYNKIEWRNNNYEESDRFLETKRGFFFKTSYLWRL